MKQWLYKLSSIIFFLIVVLIEVALGLYVHYAREISVIPLYNQVKLPQAIEYRSAEGSLLGYGDTPLRYSVSLNDVPPALVNAFLASEDASFFEHRGLDFKGILRALWVDLTTGKIKQGASTITQQMARNLLLNHEKSLERKIKEAILSRRLEEIYTKEQILELYLNLIYLGEGAYGVKAAARVYFGKRLKDLTLSEAAVIAALPQAPSVVNPVKRPDLMVKRRNRVLKRMLQQKMITKEQYKKALKEPVYAIRHIDYHHQRGMWFLDDLKESFKNSNIDATMGGLRIYGAMPVGFQLSALSAVRDGVEKLNNKQGFRGALLKIDSKDLDKARQVFCKMKGQRHTKITIGLITKVDKEKAQAITLGCKEVPILLRFNRWAGKYTQFSKDKKTNRYKRKGAVSFNRKIKSLDQALHVGDVVYLKIVKKKIRIRLSKKTSHKKRARRYRYVEVETGIMTQPYGMEGALFAMDPYTGGVLSDVGSVDYELSQFNRTDALRQTGSSIKPIYYSKAYDAGIPPSTVFSGVPFRVGRWKPPIEGKLKDMTLWEALTKSENMISVRLFQTLLARVGKSEIQEWFKKLGLDNVPQGYPAEALGMDERLRSMTGAFSVFASKGIGVRPRFIGWIEDLNGRIIKDFRTPFDPITGPIDTFTLSLQQEPHREVISREVAYLMSANLRNIVLHGTAYRAKKMKLPAFGKTGTLPFDVWFIGWTPQLIAGVWIGADHRERFLGYSKRHSIVFGGNTALPVWQRFQDDVAIAVKDYDPLKDLPDDIVWVKCDPQWGILSDRDNAISIPHIDGTQPKNTFPAPGGNMDQFYWQTEF